MSTSVGLSTAALAGSASSYGDLIVLKVLFVIALVGFVGGVVVDYRNNGYGIVCAFLCGFFYSLMLPFMVCFVGSLVYGIYWVFT